MLEATREVQGATGPPEAWPTEAAEALGEKLSSGVADREADGPPIRPEVKSAEPTEGRFLEHIKTVRQNCPHLV